MAICKLLAGMQKTKNNIGISRFGSALGIRPNFTKLPISAQAFPYLEVG